MKNVLDVNQFIKCQDGIASAIFDNVLGILNILKFINNEI